MGQDLEEKRGVSALPTLSQDRFVTRVRLNKKVLTHLGIKVGGTSQASRTIADGTFTAAQGDAIVFCFFEPICGLPVAVVVDPTAAQLQINFFSKGDGVGWRRKYEERCENHGMLTTENRHRSNLRPASQLLLKYARKTTTPNQKRKKKIHPTPSVFLNRWTDRVKQRTFFFFLKLDQQ